jgi:hypothetical protein
LKYHDDEVSKQVSMIVRTASRPAAYRLGATFHPVKPVYSAASGAFVEAITKYRPPMNEPPFPDHDGC